MFAASRRAEGSIKAFMGEYLGVQQPVSHQFPCRWTLQALSPCCSTLLPKLMVMSAPSAVQGIRDMICIQLGNWGTAGKSGCERSWEWGPDLLTPHLLEFCQANPLQTAVRPQRLLQSQISAQHEASQSWDGAPGLSGTPEPSCTIRAAETVASLENNISPSYCSAIANQSFYFRNIYNQLDKAWQPVCIILRFPAKLLKLIRCQTFIMAALINEKSRLLPQATSVNRAVQ